MDKSTHSDRQAYGGRTRKQFLEDLGKLAGTATRFDEAAATLGLKVRELKKLFDEDPAVAKAWNEPHLGMVLAIKRALLEKAHSGNITAIKAVQNSLDADDDHVGVDPAHLSGTHLASLVGVSPKTLWVWSTQHGLHKNQDGTYDLSKFLSWYKEHVAATASDGASPSADNLREEKAKTARMNRERERGRADLAQRGHGGPGEPRAGSVGRATRPREPTALETPGKDGRGN